MYACLLDSDGNVVSFPPITNSDLTKVSTRSSLVIFMPRLMIGVNRFMKTTATSSNRFGQIMKLSWKGTVRQNYPYCDVPLQ